MSQTFRLGAFIVVTLAILALGVFLVGDRQTRFQSNYRVKAQFDNVTGLMEGAAVRVGGIQKGTVRQIVLPQRPDGKVTVVMDLVRETRRLVKQDSVAAIKSEGLVGDKFLEIGFGSGDAPSLKGGETIRSVPPVDIADIIAKTDKVLDTAQAAVANIEGATGQMNEITAKINEGRGTAGALVNDKTLYQQATTGVSALREDAEALKHNFLLRGFFKKRGYESASDLTKNQVARIPDVAQLKTFSYDAKQLFDKPDSAKLKNTKAFAEAAQYLQNEKFGLALIVSSTGAKGDAAKNRELTEARAYVVRQYLVDNIRVDDQRVKTMGLGETEELGDKVEIVIYPPSAAPAAPARPQKKLPTGGTQ